MAETVVAAHDHVSARVDDGFKERAHGGDGAAPETSQATLIVENMHCGVCMRKVETALAARPDVLSARANLSARRVSVSVRGAQADIAGLVDTLKDAGYNAAELASDSRLLAQSAERDLLKRAAIAGFATANVMLLSVSVWSAAGGDMANSLQGLFHWLSALIALPVIAYAGQPFFRSAAQALLARRLNMDVPISLGVLLAAGMSLFETIKGSEQVYFDAAVTLLFFLLVGRFLDQRMRARAAGAAANLIGLQATTATRIKPDGTTERVSARLLEPGVKVLVASGERAAVDGKVVAGEGEIDESLITGESLPRAVKVGDQVYAGCVNLGGSLTISATATDQNTLLSEIGRLMEAAEQNRGAYVRLADRAAAIYAPAVHILGFATFVAWMVLGMGWEAALTAAIAVLIVTCPCALALAVPAVQIAASGRLFSRGVLVKAPDGLERLAEVDTIVFDKTGTLTLGEPRLAGVIGSDDALGPAARLAASSRHPYARALVRAARENGHSIAALDGVRETPGSGLEWADEQGTVRLGSATWCGVQRDADDDIGAAIWYRQPDGTLTGFHFEDAVRPGAADVIGKLAAAGYEIEIISGDREVAVADVASALGVDHWRGRMKPAEKIARLDDLKSEGRKVLMVGDGLNDAPALAAAHASLSPATAADISQTAADAIFQGERIDGVIDALSVSQCAKRMALQNFGIAITYNVIFVPMAMLGIVTPLIAAIAMSASSIAVTSNAVRLNVRKLELETR